MRWIEVYGLIALGVFIGWMLRSLFDRPRISPSDDGLDMKVIGRKMREDYNRNLRDPHHAGSGPLRTQESEHAADIRPGQR